MTITELQTNDEVTVSLDKYIKSANALDPVDCFSRTNSYYLGSKLLMTQVDDLWYPVQMCGSTNTGINWYGCSGAAGVAPDPKGTPLADCNWVATGESVIAQACIIDKCSGYILDTTFNPLVTLAKIDGQWNIVGVITGDAVVSGGPGKLGPGPCADACCGVGVKFLSATIDPGCGSLSGTSFELASGNGGGEWSGSITANGETFTFNVFCSVDIEGANDWSATGGCATPAVADSLVVNCSSTGTGTGGPAMEGVATFNTSGCAGCGSLTVRFVAIEKTPKDDCFTDFVETGDVVIAEACGLPDLEIDDHVIIAKVPKLGQTGTGTGTDPAEADQWHIVRACSGGIECDPCGDPPPPDPLACCGYTTATVPSTLSGLISISGTQTSAGCACEEQLISFDIDVSQDPPHWIQRDALICPETGTGTTGILLEISGMVIKCGDSTGTGTGTGTGPGSEEAIFHLQAPGACSWQTPDNADEPSSSAFCEPIYALWEGVDISDCCNALGAIPVSDPVLMTLEVSG